MDLTQILPFSIWQIVKAFFVFGLLIYLLFAIIVVRQVALMLGTVKVGFELPIRILSFVHLAAAIFVLFYALTAL